MHAALCCAAEASAPVGCRRFSPCLHHACREAHLPRPHLQGVRQDLYDALVEINPDKDWSFVLKQIGMFTFTGMTPQQCDNMTNKWHVYMTKDGRLSLAGLSSACVFVTK